MLNELAARITTWAMRARDEAGQGLVEYALILVLVSVVAIAALDLIGVEVDTVFDSVGTTLQSETP